jgi:hypothetical protein
MTCKAPATVRLNYWLSMRMWHRVLFLSRGSEGQKFVAAPAPHLQKFGAGVLVVAASMTVRLGGDDQTESILGFGQHQRIA